MAFFKEDGSLDIEWINKLPLEEHFKVVESLTEKQFKEYLSKKTINESEQVSVMSTWNQEQIMSYYMQNSISEEECFAPVLELIDDLEKLERNEHNF